MAIVLAAVFIKGNAQTEKHDWLVGGRIDFNTGENRTHIGFSPACCLRYRIASNVFLFIIAGNIIA